MRTLICSSLKASDHMSTRDVLRQYSQWITPVFAMDYNGRRITFGIGFPVTVGTDFSGTGCQVNTDCITPRLHYDIPVSYTHLDVYKRQGGVPVTW